MKYSVPDAEECLTSGVVFRLGTRSEDEMFYAEKLTPQLSDFDLGTDEETAAKATQYANLSVWDESRTTPLQAHAFVAPKRRLPIWLSVEKVLELPHALRIVSRPHDTDLPGREGHCDIENVWPRDKNSFRAIRSDLLSIARCDRREV
jgi:hypothetical protein